MKSMIGSTSLSIKEKISYKWQELDMSDEILPVGKKILRSVPPRFLIHFPAPPPSLSWWFSDENATGAHSDALTRISVFLPWNQWMEDPQHEQNWNISDEISPPGKSEDYQKPTPGRISLASRISFIFHGVGPLEICRNLCIYLLIYN
jgi:hypothetical protein